MYVALFLYNFKLTKTVHHNVMYKQSLTHHAILEKTWRAITKVTYWIMAQIMQRELTSKED